MHTHTYSAYICKTVFLLGGFSGGSASSLAINTPRVGDADYMEGLSYLLPDCVYSEGVIYWDLGRHAGATGGPAQNRAGHFASDGRTHIYSPFYLRRTSLEACQVDANKYLGFNPKLKVDPRLPTRRLQVDCRDFFSRHRRSFFFPAINLKNGATFSRKDVLPLSTSYNDVCADANAGRFTSRISYYP